MEAKVRRARPSDKEPLMQFIRHVWGGHDYIPSVWDRWLRDRSGMVFVVEADGNPVGMNRVRFLGDGSAWFEGVRIHPRYRGQGLASMLGENSLRAAGERGARVFRLTSGSNNKAAHRQISRMAFSEVARFTLYEPSRPARPLSGGAERAGSGDAERALRLAQSTKEFRFGRGVYWHDFAASSLNEATVKTLVKEGRVWIRGRAVAVAGRGREGTKGWEEISFVGGPPGEAMALLRALLGRVKGAHERWVFVPQGSPIIHALRESGFKRHFSMVLFERTAANG